MAAAVALALRNGDDLDSVEYEADFDLIGIKTEDGKPSDRQRARASSRTSRSTPIGVTEDNIVDTVIADGFRTVEEVCTGDTAQTDFCKEQQLTN